MTSQRGDEVVGPRFDEVDRFRPFELLSPGFEAVTADLDPGWHRSEWSPPAPFVTVLADGPASAVGLAAENGDHLLAVCEDGRVGLEIRTGAVTTRLVERRVRGRVRRLGFVLCENQPTVLVDTGRGWRPVAVERRRVAPRIDFRVPATLARFTAAWSGAGGVPGSHGPGDRRGRDQDGRDRGSAGSVRAGLFGMAGLRDLHLVQHADGTPYLDDRGRLFFTATCAGLGFFEQAHWGVFALDPRMTSGGTSYGSVPIASRPYDVPAKLEQTAHLFTHRDGLLLGDHAGQLVRDGDRWLVAVSSWGDFTPEWGTHVRHLTTGADLLHGVHVLETEPTPLPTDLATYDPGMTLIEGRWHVSFVASPSQREFDFHPALAVGPADATSWTDGLELVGAAPELHQCEGPVLARLPARPRGTSYEPEAIAPDPYDATARGEWRLLASDGDARCYRVFDLAMRPVGRLDAPYRSNIPHPQVVETPEGELLLVTFDGTAYAERVLGYGSHGDVLVMRARR